MIWRVILVMGIVGLLWSAGELWAVLSKPAPHPPAATPAAVDTAETPPARARIHPTPENDAGAGMEPLSVTPTPPAETSADPAPTQPTPPLETNSDTNQDSPPPPPVSVSSPPPPASAVSDSDAPRDPAPMAAQDSAPPAAAPAWRGVYVPGGILFLGPNGARLFRPWPGRLAPLPSYARRAPNWGAPRHAW
jgi:hypothetical protein